MCFNTADHLGVLQYGRSSRGGCVVCDAEPNFFAAEGRENLAFYTVKSEKVTKKQKFPGLATGGAF